MCASDRDEPDKALSPTGAGDRDGVRTVKSQRPHGRNFTGPWPRTPGRLLGTGFIRLYQLTLSGFIGNSCRHLPTCSEYGFEAIARHGLWKGGWLALFRVGRCGPGGTHGIDNVPEVLDRRFVWWAPWRLISAGKRAD